MKKRIAIITDDLFLYQKIYLMINPLALVVDSVKEADLCFFDLDSSSACPCEGRVIRIGRGDGDLLRPFSEEQLLSLMLKPDIAQLVLGDRRVYLRGREVKLTEVEFDLLSCLVSAGGEFVARETLLNSVWGNECDGGILNVYIHYLREKLETEGEKIIFSSRKMGYKIDAKYLVKGEKTECLI